MAIGVKTCKSCWIKQETYKYRLRKDLLNWKSWQRFEKKRLDFTEVNNKKKVQVEKKARQKWSKRNWVTNEHKLKSKFKARQLKVGKLKRKQLCSLICAKKKTTVRKKKEKKRNMEIRIYSLEKNHLFTKGKSQWEDCSYK
jgi:hypothetical protein